MQFRDFGELLFTHFGVSGPLVLSASAHLRHWDREQYRLSIDLKPALDREKLEAASCGTWGRIPTGTSRRYWLAWYPTAWCR